MFDNYSYYHNRKHSNIIDHATTEQHHAAMNHVRKEAAKASNLLVTSYSPIARRLITVDESVRSRMTKKFCYVMAKEGMAFKKFPTLHALEERHDVDLGFSYKNAPSAKTFTHYIAESQRQSFPASFFCYLKFLQLRLNGCW